MALSLTELFALHMRRKKEAGGPYGASRLRWLKRWMDLGNRGF